MGEAKRKRAAKAIINPLTKRIDRTETELHLVVSFERPPTPADCARLRETLMPWDLAENFASRIEHDIASAEGERLMQLGIRWELADLDTPEAMEEVRYVMRLFMDMGDPGETEQARAGSRALRSSGGGVPSAT